MFDPETTIIADNMTYEEDEDLNEKAESMIRQGLALNNIGTRLPSLLLLH